MKKVKIYTTPICPQCERAKEFLKDKKIRYEEIDVSKNKEQASQIFEKSGKKIVPIIEIGNKIIIGFDRKSIEKTLDMK